MQTTDYLLTKLMWPPDPLEPTAKREHRRQLHAARNCLLREAPAEFFGTGLHLLHKDRESDLRECIEAILSEGFPDDLLLMFQAPELDERSTLIYRKTIEDMVDRVAAEIERASEKLIADKITSRFFNRCHEALDNVELYVTDSHLAKVRAYLHSFGEAPLESDRKGYSAKLMKLSQLTNRFEWET